MFTNANHHNFKPRAATGKMMYDTKALRHFTCVIVNNTEGYTNVTKFILALTVHRCSVTFSELHSI